MNTLKLSIHLVLLGSLTVTSALNIDEQIAAIEAATPEEKVVLVNRFKEVVSTLSSQERASAIYQFRSTMRANNNQIQINQASTNQIAQAQSLKEAQQINQQQNTAQVIQQSTALAIQQAAAQVALQQEAAMQTAMQEAAAQAAMQEAAALAALQQQEAAELAMQEAAALAAMQEAAALAALQQDEQVQSSTSANITVNPPKSTK